MGVLTYSSDTELLGALSLGEAKAFETLVRTYTKEMLQQAYRRLRNQADAEDVVQDLFVDLWEKRQQLNIKTSFSAYLHTALKYQILRRIERTNLHEKAVEHLLHRIDDMQAGILDVLAAKDLEATLSEAVALLPENMRKVFVLRGRDYSLKEIAQALGLAEQTVKSYNAELIRRIKVAVVEKHPGIDQSLLLTIAYLLTKN